MNPRAWNRAVNGAFAAASAPDALRFRAGLRALQRVQERALRGYLAANRDTAFGRRHGFAGIDGLAGFRRRVPVAGYDAFLPYVERIAAGERGVLTREDVLLLEPTGGTTSGSKWVPYTRSLKREFRRAVQAWVFDLQRSFPGLLGTRSYWSVTPAGAARGRTKGGIPMGFEDDAEYLGALGAALRRVFAVPPGVRLFRDMRNFRYATGYFLLAAHDLGLVSVWNPTFLILLLEGLERDREALVRDLHDGRLRLPAPGEETVAVSAAAPSPGRARRVAAALDAGGEDRYRRVWKQLRVVSCWADGASRMHAEKVAALFPGVHVQPKGLLATECLVSFPLAAAAGSVLAYRSHFFEFLPDGGGGPRLAHELSPGEAYTVVVTTGGGLYRYDTGDRVEVTGGYRGLPVLRFAGRRRVSDLVGEKLEEGHVQAVVEAALARHGIACEFVLFAPETTPDGGAYTLYLEPCAPVAGPRRQAVAQEIDRGLGANVQYRYARELGQLRAPAVFVVPGGSGRETYLRRCVEEGQRLGDVKQSVLDRRTGWARCFAPADGDGPGGSPPAAG